MKKLIAFEEGLSAVLRNAGKPEAVVVPLSLSLGRVLAADCRSPFPSPGFDQSAMDGYAFRYEDFIAAQPLRIIDIIKAGDNKKTKWTKGTCTRIFTGAPIPTGADTVVMQEKVVVRQNELLIQDDRLVKGSNVRLKASHLQSGQIIARKGTRITAPLIAVLAAAGNASVSVIKQPTFGIIVTGDELVKPGDKLKHGQVYECNSYSLQAALQSVLPGVKTKTYRVRDSAKATLAGIKKALKENDCILLTGGVSVGDFDFVVPALKEAGVKIIFHKLLQKPGKPVCFGKLNQQLVFGLPGNPASVLSCFYTLVWPSLVKFAGAVSGVKENLPLSHSYHSKPGLTRFLKALVKNGKVTILKDQESYKLNSFAEANALVKLPADIASVDEGESVKVIFLPL
mgnify:CR=1 FL=1